MEFVCSALSVGFAAIAALLWLCSARVKLPVLKSALVGIDSLGPFYLATKRVARLNAGAAAFVFLSAFTQGRRHGAGLQ
jgi:hypothetical protein